MIGKDEFEKLINSIREKLDETQRALISEDLISVLSNYTSALEEMSKANERIEELAKDKEELLLANGRLFQKVGFEEKIEDKIEGKEDEEQLSIDDIIDEKGELI